MAWVGEDVEKLKANEFSGLDLGKVRLFPAGAFWLGFEIVESTDEVVADAHDGVGIWGVDEVCVVVVPLKGFLALKGLAQEEGEVALAIELKVLWDGCSGEFTDCGKPVD